MTGNPRTADETSDSDAENVQSDTINPRDTDHPTGSEQAAENAANEPPG